MHLPRFHHKLLLIALSLACLAAHAAETRTPTQDGILYGTADGQPLTMDYYAPKGPGPHPIAIIIHGRVAHPRFLKP
jgi:alpha-L-fucosidase 2